MPLESFDIRFLLFIYLIVETVGVVEENGQHVLKLLFGKSGAPSNSQAVVFAGKCKYKIKDFYIFHYFSNKNYWADFTRKDS